MHGEHTPPSVSAPATLTPLGAQQMYSQGAAFRGRYLRPAYRHSRDAASGCHGSAPIDGIEPDAIDNSHLTVLSLSHNHTVASAIVFMQGLYSPSAQAISDCPEADWPVSGSWAESPPDGYQYPNITTVQLGHDPESIMVHGVSYCNKHATSLSTDDVFSGYSSSSRQFYRDLWSKGTFGDSFSLEQADFSNAYNLYECASYNWAYNDDTKCLITDDDLSRLHQHASAEQWIRNANLTVSGKMEGDMIRGVAGLTVASGAVALFTENIVSCGRRNKLNLIFTSHDPFIAFSAVAKSQFMHQDGGHVSLDLPQPGTAITFELFSYEPYDNCKLDPSYGGGNTYLSDCDLWVRFIYHSLECPFGGWSFTMRFEDFNSTVQRFGVDNAEEWCRKCESNADFCDDKDGAVAVALGGAAVVVIIVAIILILTLC
ncbi:hypothetical protein MFIFM68171_03300 [Madurella fahalii]|uniref:Uncharacterized protein n=1 Tax=Madurella fahalii TaxID=1157608 RepID=A0ABQ0G5T5_9PEZI